MAIERTFTEEEYLRFERASDVKHEFLKGRVFAMSGASVGHNVITVNVIGELLKLLRGKPCRPYGSDMRVHSPARGFYTYPDISVVCGEIKLLDDQFDTMLNPVFIAEVLSPSTKSYDIDKKFKLYQSIETLREYWTIATDQRCVNVWVKQPDNNWKLTETTHPNATIPLTALGLSLEMNAIYVDTKL